MSSAQMAWKAGAKAGQQRSAEKAAGSNPADPYMTLLGYSTPLRNWESAAG